ncbi:hypothetical protein [Ideonella margarita]|uniref:Uncharacterized protein n=1 Tax=Ideonella margarita TaxID=2984191 RepID=A0ABU9C8F3_9BURK
MDGIDDEDIDEVDAVGKLTIVAKALHGSLTGYSKYREDWLSGQVTLNLQGKVAPLYRRPALRPAKIPVTREEALYSLDRQVIDLHWLHCTGFRFPIGQTQFATLLTDENFDWDLACDFALSLVKTEIKVTQWLSLDELSAWELASLQATATRKRLFDLRKQEPVIRQRLTTVHRGRPNAADLIQLDVTHWWVKSTIGVHSATARAKAFALCLGLDSPPTAAVFARQATAAEKRLATGKSTVRAAA